MHLSSSKAIPQSYSYLKFSVYWVGSYTPILLNYSLYAAVREQPGG